MDYPDIEIFLKQSIGLDATTIGLSSIERAVRRRVQACSLGDWKEYLGRIRASDDELQALIEAVVVPETWFFRDKTAFTAMVSVARAAGQPGGSVGKLRLLSAPCSSGEEPFSMVMALLDAGFGLDHVEVDAWDISSQALAKARCAVYGKNSFRGQDVAFRRRHFEPIDGKHRVNERIRQVVTFRQLNLLSWEKHLPPACAGYDFVFCRNLLIYLDPTAQGRVLELVQRVLKPAGLLFVAPAEAGLCLRAGFRSAGLSKSSAFRQTIQSQPAALNPPTVASAGIQTVFPPDNDGLPTKAFLGSPGRAPAPADSSGSESASTDFVSRLEIARHLAVETIRSCGDALLTVINDILDFSKIESGRLSLEEHPFELRLCVEEVLELLGPKAADKSLDLACRIDESIPPDLTGDVTRLRQILVNLVGNAVKFTERGEVIVDVHPAPVASLIGGAPRRAPVLDAGGTESFLIQFCVRDTGIGIPAEKQDRLFKSFTQVDSSTARQYGGTGLGLALSRRLAELMGGEMSVESQAGQGATFRFTIRVKQAPAPTAAPLPVGLSGQRVLLVEDHAINRQIFGQTFSQWGMSTVAAGSEAEALANLQKLPPFDVVILDAQLPNCDPFALVERIRQSTAGQNAALVLLSSAQLRAGDPRAQRAGIVGVISKPIRHPQLRDILQRTRAGLSIVRRGPLRSEIDRTLAERLPLRLLLADDNRVNQKVGTAFLERMGYHVEVACNGLDVLRALDRQSFDVIFLDVHMPEMDGYEVARRIREKWPGLDRPCVIAMTGNTTDGDRELCLAAGMDDYLAKPVRAKELERVLLHWGPRRRGPDRNISAGDFAP